MAPKYVLHYWSLPGRGEPIRCAFFISGVEFEDKRYTKDAYMAMKENTTQFPLGQLPTLDIDGEPSVQSYAILRYVAAENNLYGETNKERLKIDEVMYTTLNIFEKFSKSFFWEPSQEEKGKQLKELFGDYIPRALKMFEKMLEKRSNQDGFFNGDQICVADLVLFNMVEMIQLDFNLEEYRKTVESYPLLCKLIEKIRNYGKMKEYLDKRGNLNELYRQFFPDK